MDTPTGRYVREFSITITVYVLTVIGSSLALNSLGSSAWRVPVALLPVIPVVFLLIVFLRYLSAMDELQQRIQLHAIAFAAGATALLTFAYGFLENVDFPHLSPLYVFSLMVILWGLGVAYYSRRYQ